MTRIYLITGFLGSGKTTFLKNLLAEFPGEKSAVLVNEFASLGVDGKLLSDLKALVCEISGGSIFCTCKAHEFERALFDILSRRPDLLIIEASGLADPSCARELIRKTQDTRYMGNICIVDAARFYKVYETSMVIRKQIAVCDAALINKADLAATEQIRAARRLIASHRPDLRIYETSYGRIEPAWREELLNPERTGEGGAMQTHDLSLRKNIMYFSDDFSYESMEKLLSLLCEQTYRVKGFVVLDHRPYYVDCVGGSVSITEYEHNEPGALVVLYGSKMPAMSLLKTIKQMYGERILSVE